MAKKPFKENLTTNVDQSILFRRIIREARPELTSEGVWHFHPDYEITYTIKSKGKRFVGYNISDYVEHDFVLIGNNLPHCWITNEHTEQIVLNFKKDIFGDIFWNIPEIKKIKQMLVKSNQGIFYTKKTAYQILDLLLSLENLKGFDKLMLFLKLLDIMSNAEDQKFLTFFEYENEENLRASNRIEKIYSYILNNYQQESFSLTELSHNINMSKNSVCRFIKKLTKKTFSEIVIETKINKACKLLIETDMFISQICYNCGFNNLSNFNRFFKKLLSLTPSQYRDSYRISRKSILSRL